MLGAMKVGLGHPSLSLAALCDSHADTESSGAAHSQGEAGVLVCYRPTWGSSICLPIHQGPLSSPTTSSYPQVLLQPVVAFHGYPTNHMGQIWPILNSGVS